jgi:hypothetical protein
MMATGGDCGEGQGRDCLRVTRPLIHRENMTMLGTIRAAESARRGVVSSYGLKPDLVDPTGSTGANFFRIPPRPRDRSRRAPGAARLSRRRARPTTQSRRSRSRTSSEIKRFEEIQARRTASTPGGASSARDNRKRKAQPDLDAALAELWPKSRA